MIYKQFQDLKLSALGMGAMRLPVLNGEDNQIDEEATQQMVDYAMEQGINYYDTAWGYHGGMSEIAMGAALKKYPRDSFYLASKFPGYDLANMDKVEKIFNRQLRKCKVDYFDFYLFHNVCEMNIDAYLDEKYGIYDYLMKEKKAGRIRHLGFSAHGSYEVMKRFLDAYGKDMEFGQIQLNYFDWSFQDAKAKVELLREYNIPIWVMEPVRGGMLANLSDNYAQELKALRPRENPVAWSFRFLQGIPDVTVVLSGMSDFEQLKENIETYQEERPLNEEENRAILSVADRMIREKYVPCTACHYCTSYCTQGLDIPELIALYNEHCSTENDFLASMAVAALPENKRPQTCIRCRACESVCPQGIKISEVMADFEKRLG